MVLNVEESWNFPKSKVLKLLGIFIPSKGKIVHKVTTGLTTSIAILRRI